ncbi:MAG: hypothetical protein Q4D55_04320 [Eubacteriales bacterium]|nr:hypothetical protein [Eubacteriales bacterium]
MLMEELLQNERELGRKEGREEGLDRMSCLMRLLKENGRMDDMQRSWSDKKLLNQLFKEYNI